MGQCLIDQCFNRDIVQHIAIVVDNAVLPMGGERIQRHIGNHPQLRMRLFQGTNRPLGQAIRIPRAGAGQILFLRWYHREQRQGGNTQLYQFRRLLHQQIDAKALDTRHGGYGFTLILAFKHKHRENQVIG